MNGADLLKFEIDKLLQFSFRMIHKSLYCLQFMVQ